MRGHDTDTTRRTFLRTTAVTGALATAGLADVATARGERVPLTHGLAAGDVRADSVVLWARAADEAYLQFELATDPQFDDSTPVRPVRVTESTDYTGQVLVEGLDPGTRHHVRAWARTTSDAGRPADERGEDEYASGTFVTAPAADERAPLTLAWTGDTYGFGDDPVDPPFDALASVADLAPDCFLYLGDTIYADAATPAGRVTEETSPDEALPIYRAKYREMRDPADEVADTSYLRTLLGSTSVYAMWDDHEVINNFAGPVEGKMPAGRRAFREYWPLNRDPSGDDGGRLYGSFQWGTNAELFVIDTRQYRDPNEASEGKTLLGDDQFAWLTDALAASDATFKLVASPPPWGYPSDSWFNRAPGTGYEAELHDLLSAVAGADVENVVVLAGDVHQPYVAAYDVDGDGTPDVYEAVAGPAGAPGDPAAGQFYGAMNPRTLWTPAEGWGDDGSSFNNYGVVRVDGSELTLAVHDEAGRERFSTTVTASTGGGNERADGNGSADGNGAGGEASDRRASGDGATGDRSTSGGARRFATAARGGGFGGLHVTPDDRLLANVTHPSSANQASVDWAPRRYDDGAVGAVVAAAASDIPPSFVDVPAAPNGLVAEQVTTAFGTHGVLANGGDTLVDGVHVADGEGLGVAATPDGRALTDADAPAANVLVSGDGTTDALYTGWASAPGAVSRLTVAREDDRDPEWVVEAASNLDLVSTVAGGWAVAAASRTPWGTPLATERLAFPETRRWNDPDAPRAAAVERLADHLGADGDYEDPASYPNPYRNGHAVEVLDPASDDPTPVRRFALGRFAHAGAVVMPDARTVYLLDGADGGALFRFVADGAGDLSAGTLAAARLLQDGASDPAVAGFDVEWVELGRADEATVAEWVAEYDDVSRANYEDGETSYVSDSAVRRWAAGDAADDRVAFLESRRAAAAAGATVEWNRLTAVAFGPTAGGGEALYAAVAAVDGAMADDEGDVRLDRHPHGAVYRLRFDEDAVVRRADPVAVGSADGFRSPASLTVLPDGRLLVGDDGDRENDAAWVVDPRGQGRAADAR